MHTHICFIIMAFGCVEVFIPELSWKLHGRVIP